MHYDKFVGFSFDNTILEFFFKLKNDEKLGISNTTRT